MKSLFHRIHGKCTYHQFIYPTVKSCCSYNLWKIVFHCSVSRWIDGKYIFHKLNSVYHIIWFSISRRIHSFLVWPCQFDLALSIWFDLARLGWHVWLANLALLIWPYQLPYQFDLAKLSNSLTFWGIFFSMFCMYIYRLMKTLLN